MRSQCIVKICVLSGEQRPQYIRRKGYTFAHGTEVSHPIYLSQEAALRNTKGVFQQIDPFASTFYDTVLINSHGILQISPKINTCCKCLNSDGMCCAVTCHLVSGERSDYLKNIILKNIIIFSIPCIQISARKKCCDSDCDFDPLRKDIVSNIIPNMNHIIHILF
eukprot:394303_1